MTIDEAIIHAEEVAYQKDLESGFDTDNERYAMTDKERTACKKCAEEHRQLAEWLKDYKRLLEQENCEDCIRAEISEAMDMEPAWKGQDNYIGGLQIACSIIDKYRNGGE